MKYKELIETKLASIIDTIYDTNKYQIAVEYDPSTLKYKVTITSPDTVFLGQLIGKQGANLNHIRALFNIVENKNNFHASIWTERLPLQK